MHAMAQATIPVPVPAASGAADQPLPAVGLGLWKVERPATAGLVERAIGLGYRHLDSASDYGNEAEAGEGIARALAGGLCRRDELWVTSKLWNTYHEPRHVRPALERSLRDLRLDHLDLYLVHFPIALEFVPFETRYPPGWFFDPDAAEPAMRAARVPLAETWAAMERLVDAGLVRRIGVCNYGVSLLRDLLAAARIPPAVLQVEMHPLLAQEKLLRFCRESGIAVTAFSPLGAPSYVPLGMATAADSLLTHPVVSGIAAAVGRTPAQVLLRWGVQRGTAVIPKTSRPERLAENLAVSDFTLSGADMAAIGGLDAGRRFNDPGVFCEQAFNTFFPIYE
jgi:D-xylose reductase